MKKNKLISTKYKVFAEKVNICTVTNAQKNANSSFKIVGNSAYFYEISMASQNLLQYNPTALSSHIPTALC